VRQSARDLQKDGQKDGQSKRQANENRSENRKEKNSPRSSGYDDLVQRTAELWREQLGGMVGNQAAMQDMSRVMEPVSQLFTQGMDMWFSMFDQFGKTPSFSAFGGFNEPKSRARNAAADGAKAASALSGAGSFAMGQLAARLGHIERRLAAIESGIGSNRSKPARSRPSRKSKKASAENRATQGA
jgi:hypothetical protein